jgi:hypothetical protein
VRNFTTDAAGNIDIPFQDPGKETSEANLIAEALRGVSLGRGKLLSFGGVSVDEDVQKVLDKTLKFTRGNVFDDDAYNFALESFAKFRNKEDNFDENLLTQGVRRRKLLGRGSILTSSQGVRETNTASDNLLGRGQSF